ncbi:MAG: ABC transporter permease [Candidatus Hodarchaeales archaeon]|jgi:peptide/nickel transport system permease protein
MTQIAVESSKVYEQEPIKKSSKLRLLKFYLIPGWRNPDFSAREYEIGKIKSKRRLFRRLLTPLTIAGLTMILFIAVVGIFSAWLTPFPIECITKAGCVIPEPLQHLEPIPYGTPSSAHPLGTSKNGYDVLARIIWGARTALTAAVVPVVVGTLGGLVVGTISAYFGGKVDSIIMRFCDFWFALPTFIIIIIISPMLGRDLYNILLLYGIFSIPGSARWVRALVLQVRQNVYVRAAVTGGAEKFKVMFKHVLPNAISPVIIGFFGAMGGAILGFAGIAFLRMGDERFADWGTDISYGLGHLAAYWTIVWPGLFISIAAIGFMLIGDGLRDALDPRLHI